MKIQNVNTSQAYQNLNSTKKTSSPSFTGYKKVAQDTFFSSFDTITETSLLKTLGEKFLSSFKGKHYLTASKDSLNVGLFRTPKNLTNHIGDININRGVEVKGTYDAGSGIISKGALAKDGVLKANGNIFIQDSPAIEGKLLSKNGDIHINAKIIEGADIEGRCVSIQSRSNRIENQAFVKAKEDADVFCPLEASMITGEDVKIHTEANLKDSFVSGKRVFINSKMESTTISAKLLELGENARIGKDTKIMADEIKDYRLAQN